MQLRISLVPLVSLVSFNLCARGEVYDDVDWRLRIASGDTAVFKEIYEANRGELGRYGQLLRHSALAWLEREVRCGVAARERLALVCATLTADEKTLFLFEAALASRDPQMQFLALQGLCRYHSTEAERALRKAMNSPYLELRWEVASLLAEGRYPSALEQIEGLMHKCDSVVHHLFPQLYAALGTPAAECVLKRMLVHPCRQVRVEAIVNAAHHGIGAMTAAIRSLATHSDPVQQEAAAYALGVLNDGEALVVLRRLATSPTREVALAANFALYQLGENTPKDLLHAYAEKGDLYAIGLLGEVEGSTELLTTLLGHPSPLVRVNAAVALLHHGSATALPTLTPWLLNAPIGRPLVKKESPGKALYVYVAAPIFSPEEPQAVLLDEMWLATREEWLSMAAQLPTDKFLPLAEAIVTSDQTDLVPQLFELLADHSSEATEAFLVKHAQRLGAPLVRHYCHLALCRRDVDSPSYLALQQWVEERWHFDFLSFRPRVEPMKSSKYELKPQETTRLFLAILDTFAERRDAYAVEWFLRGMIGAHPNLRSAFAALLVRALQ